jgi:hypothetical protein
LGVDPASQVLGKVVADHEFSAHDAMGLGVPTALKVSRSPEPVHLGAEGRNDVLKMGLFVRLRPFLGELQTLVSAPLVDERGDQVREPFAKECVEGRPDEWIDAALELQ